MFTPYCYGVKMSYRVFAAGTLLAAPILVMAVQSFTSHPKVEAPTSTTQSEIVPVAAVAEPYPSSNYTPDPAQSAPSGPMPVFGRPLPGAGQPANPLGHDAGSNETSATPDLSENF